MATALAVLGRYPVPHRIAKLMPSAVSQDILCNQPSEDAVSCETGGDALDRLAQNVPRFYTKHRNSTKAL